MATPFDYPIASLNALTPGLSSDASIVAALLQLMKEAHAGDYTPSAGNEPVPATHRAVVAKFGEGPVARLVRRVVQ